MDASSKEAKVAEFLVNGQADWQASPVAELELRKRSRMRLRPRAIASVAAALILSLIVTSLYIPQLARAISVIPWVGGAYEKLLVRSGSNIAYSAGLLSELDLVAKNGDMTVTVLGAYADPLVTMVTLKVQLDDGSTKSLCAPPPDHRDLRLSMHGRWKWRSGNATSFWDYDEDEDALYYSFQTEPLPWWEGGTVGLKVESAAARIELDVPVQRLPAADVETIRINKTYLNGKLVVEKAVFSPGRTQIYWTVRDGYRGMVKLIPDDGTELRERRFWRATKAPYVVGKPQRFFMEYMPTQRRQFTVSVGHFFQEEQLSLPLKAGAKTKGSNVEAQLELIAQDEERTDIAVLWLPNNVQWEPFYASMYVGRSSSGAYPMMEESPGKLLVSWPFKWRNDYATSHHLRLFFRRRIVGTDQFTLTRP